MAEVLVDTDVLIDHLRGAAALTADADRLSYSVVTRCELFAGTRVDENVVRRVLSALNEIPVDRAIAERAGRIRRALGIRTPDALIAATALVNGFQLRTRNRRHFGTVPGLILWSPPE
ncbi:MAG: type II toxin-antitoxin system VapC family toxin [Acidimicrobiales bacterium]